MADDFGSYLKHERELRGISLEEIASVTKIHIKYLKALEAGQFDQLPGEVFIKGFIRSYGKAIGSNADELLTAYDETAGRERRESRQPASDAGEEETRRQVHTVNLLVGGFLLIFLVFAIWYLVQNPPRPSPQESVPPPPATVPAPLPDRSLAAPGEVQAPEREDSSKPPPDGASLEEKDTEAGRPAPTPATPAPKEKAVTGQENGAIIKPLQDQQVKEETAGSGPAPAETSGLHLTIKARENSWFNLRVDEGREQDFILPAGASKTFQAQKGFRVTIGNRRGTELTLNGQPLTLPESPDNVVRDFKITSETPD